MKKTLLRLLGIALAIGCASPGAVGPAYVHSALDPAIQHQTLLASAVGFVSQGTSAGVAHAAGLQLPSGANGAASSSHESKIALAMTQASAGSPLRASRTPDRRPGLLVPAEAVPEPSSGAMLICALAILAFIARRKI